MAVTVKLPTILRKHAGGEAKVGADGATLRDVLTDLEGHYPGITKNVISDDGGLHRFPRGHVYGKRVMGNAPRRQGLGRGPQLPRAAVQQHHARALLAEQAPGRRADAARAAGNDRNPAVQPTHGNPLFLAMMLRARLSFARSPSQHIAYDRVSIGAP